MLDAKTRVIAADIQWIIQKRWGKEWRGELYFRSKEGLLMYVPKPIAPELLALPDWFPENDLARSVARPDPPGWGLENGSHISRFNIHTTLTCTVKSFFCHQTTPIFGYTNGLKRNGE